jgi:soluble lytic murein transglycosylase-like protein
MPVGVKIIRKIGVIVSKPVGFLLILLYVAQTGLIVYLFHDKFEKEKILRQQQMEIMELQEKLKILNIIEDFQVGFNDKEVGTLTQVVHTESKKYGYDPLLILALILTESSFRKGQVSTMGAQGLMQLKPSIGYDLAKRRGLNWKGELSLFEPAFNIQLGTLYLFEQILKFRDVKKALVAYNLGDTALKLRLKSGQKPPTYFLRKVLKKYQELKEKYDRPDS